MLPSDMQDILAKILFFVFATSILCFAKVQAETSFQVQQQVQQQTQQAYSGQ